MVNHLVQHLLSLGVPQGMILGPIIFLVYINDINENISYIFGLTIFADDCIIYRPITTLQDAKQLQKDLCKICAWTNKWQMKINIDRCAVLCCTHSLIPIQYTYTLMGHNLEVKKLYTYHGLGIDNTISWSLHIQTINNRSTKVLNFIKRNLNNCPLDTKNSLLNTS